MSAAVVSLRAAVEAREDAHVDEILAGFVTAAGVETAMGIIAALVASLPDPAAEVTRLLERLSAEPLLPIDDGDDIALRFVADAIAANAADIHAGALFGALKPADRHRVLAQLVFDHGADQIKRSRS